MTSSPPLQTFYDAVGGHDTFVALVKRFYEGVASDPALRALYPEDDLGPAEVRFRMFLAQYWGGPTTYNDERGHPRLRMRHMPFTVGPQQRDRWLTHMRAAVNECAPSPAIATQLMAYFEPAAEQMRNDTGLPISSPRPRQ